MIPATLLHRQAHPNFVLDGQLTSQAFFPFPKDQGELSVYDGDQISALDSYVHYTTVSKNESVGVWSVSCGEVDELGLSSKPDPKPDFPSHAAIVFTGLDEKACRKLAKKLKTFAVARSCAYTPPA